MMKFRHLFYLKFILPQVSGARMLRLGRQSPQRLLALGSRELPRIKEDRYVDGNQYKHRCIYCSE